MSIGESARHLFIEKDTKSTFELVKEAGSNIGKIKESDSNLNILTIKTRYGLQGVKLRVSLEPKDNGTIVYVSGFGADVWGGGAKKGTDKLFSAMSNLIS